MQEPTDDAVGGLECRAQEREQCLHTLVEALTQGQRRKLGLVSVKRCEMAIREVLEIPWIEPREEVKVAVP